MSARGGGAPIIVVSGLPRSGTAMAMRMLEAGGVPLLVDDARPADEGNPRGYYELAAVKRIRADTSFLAGAPGRAVKIVSPLLDALPAGYAYDVVLLHRPLAEVLASQTAMLERAGMPGGEDERTVAAALAKHLEWLDAWARTPPAHVRVLALDHHDVVRAPHAAADQLAAFLGRPLDVAAMAAVVEPALHRQRG